MAVSIVTALAEVVVKDFAGRASVPLSLVAGLGASAVTIAGSVFLSGFLSKLVAREAGSQSPSIWQVMRTLRWARLAGADLLVALLVVLGLLALVIPGLVAINLLAVTGPVIEIEGRPVLAALRRSVRLVRPRFWMVALLATLPVLAASEIETVAPRPESMPAILEILAIRGLAEGIAQAAIGLTLVMLCRRLIELDRARPATADHEPCGPETTPAQAARHRPR